MAGSLVLISSQTISSSISSIDFDNVFSAKYDVYKIINSNLSTVSAVNGSTDMRLLDSTGTVISANEYDYAQQILRTNSAFGERKATSATSWSDVFGAEDEHPESNGTVMYVFNPFDSSSYTFIAQSNVFSVANVHRGYKGIGVHKSAESCRGFQVSFQQNADGGVFSVFGVK